LVHNLVDLGDDNFLLALQGLVFKLNLLFLAIRFTITSIKLTFKSVEDFIISLKILIFKNLLDLLNFTTSFANLDVQIVNDLLKVFIVFLHR
jgi:hypothetical protein